MTTKKQSAIDLASSTITGMTIAGAFNPLDKALNAAMVNKRSFFDIKNFTNPYHAASQSIASKAFSDGIYFLLQSQVSYLFNNHIKQSLHLNDWQNQLGIGLTAGSLRGLLINPLNAIRFRAWKTNTGTFYSTAHDMRVRGHLQSFMKGTTPTIARDAVFGVVYEVIRHRYHDQPLSPFNQVAMNMGAASLAAMFSSPLNYWRSMVYASSPEVKSPSMRKVFSELAQESKAYTSPLGKLGFFQKRFVIGSGTARVAIGMAAGQFLFDHVKRGLEQLDQEQEEVQCTRPSANRSAT